MIHVFGPAEASAVTQLESCLAVTGDEARGVLCADHHKGYSMPIGGVLASQTHVIPAGVGYDIGCGNLAIRTNLKAPDLHSELSRLMTEIATTISFGVGRQNSERVDDPVFDDIKASPVSAQRGLLELAHSQLGTVGSGNHYVDLFEDRVGGDLWIGIHFGSRGFGHKTACGFLALAAGLKWGDKTSDDMDAAPTTIPLGTPLADDYLAAMTIAGAYAYAGRSWVGRKVLSILGATAVDEVHNHHNFAWWEEHQGQRWIVIRKGATPAFPGQRGFVGGTMGDDAVILEGCESAESAEGFYSTVHGAGRVMGRRQATGVWKKGVCVRPGLVDWEAWQQTLRERGIHVRGGGADEAPECYKRLSDVLGYHGNTVRVLHTLKPIGVAMAGRDVVDPYKD